MGDGIQRKNMDWNIFANGIWGIFMILTLAGGLGGVINALMTDNGFVFPKWEDANGNKIWRPGMLGNVIIGAVAAVISWGLYGPFADYVFIGAPTANPAIPYLTVSAFVGAILIGVGGARWLSNEVDKKLLKSAAVAAAAGNPAPGAAIAMMAATPAGALEIAQSLNR
jgi:hypothetical protein